MRGWGTVRGVGKTRERIIGLMVGVAVVVAASSMSSASSTTTPIAPFTDSTAPTAANASSAASATPSASRSVDVSAASWSARSAIVTPAGSAPLRRITAPSAIRFLRSIVTEPSWRCGHANATQSKPTEVVAIAANDELRNLIVNVVDVLACKRQTALDARAVATTDTGVTPNP